MTCTISLSPAQAAVLSPLRCLAAEAAQQGRPGLVLAQVWFYEADWAVLEAKFCGPEEGAQIQVILRGGKDAVIFPRTS